MNRRQFLIASTGAALAPGILTESLEAAVSDGDVFLDVGTVTSLAGRGSLALKTTGGVTANIRALPGTRLERGPSGLVSDLAAFAIGDEVVVVLGRDPQPNSDWTVAEVKTLYRGVNGQVRQLPRGGLLPTSVGDIRIDELASGRAPGALRVGDFFSGEIWRDGRRNEWVAAILEH